MVKPASKPIVDPPPGPVAMSASATAPAFVPPVLKFTNQSIRDIQAGSKTATIRKGVRTFSHGLIQAIGSGGTSLVLQNVTTTPKKFSQLTDADAKANGSDSLDELKGDLERNYPGIDPDDVVTVINFRVTAK